MSDQAAETPLDATLRLASAGDAAAWERLVGLYSGRVYGLLVRRCGDRDLAEELTQATFVKLVVNLKSFSGYEERGKFEAWLFRIAMNGLRDEMRRRKRQAKTMDMSPGGLGVGGGLKGTGDVESRRASGGFVAAAKRAAHSGADGGGSGGPAEVLSAVEEQERLRQAVSELGDADQEVLYLRHTAGLSFQQIAETLGQPLGTVLAREHRALGKLRKMLGDQ